MIAERGSSFTVRVWDPLIGRKRWIGSYKTREEAQKAEEHALADRIPPDERLPPRPRWSLAGKDEVVCRNCDAAAVDLHHIVPLGEFPPECRSGFDVRFNGLPLCRACHLGWHSRSVVIEASKLKPREIAFAREVMGEDWVQDHYPSTAGEQDAYERGYAQGRQDGRAQVLRQMYGLLQTLGVQRPTSKEGGAPPL